MTRFSQLLMLLSILGVFKAPAQAVDQGSAPPISQLPVQVAEQGSTSTKPDDAKPDNSTPGVEKRQGWGNQSIENCMAMWDAGTHMTKSEWRRTCEGIAKERAPYLNKGN
jgi:hypothetical protein